MLRGSHGLVNFRASRAVVPLVGKGYRFGVDSFGCGIIGPVEEPNGNFRRGIPMDQAIQERSVGFHVEAEVGEHPGSVTQKFVEDRREKNDSCLWWRMCSLLVGQAPR